MKGLLCKLENQREQQVEQRAQGPGDGDGDEPGEEDPLCHQPVDGLVVLRRAHPHDGEETIWLADTGAPSREEARITDPAVSWEAKEWMGWTL